jgi:hypothetical protein
MGRIYGNLSRNIQNYNRFKVVIMELSVKKQRELDYEFIYGDNHYVNDLFAENVRFEYTDKYLCIKINFDYNIKKCNEELNCYYDGNELLEHINEFKSLRIWESTFNKRLREFYPHHVKAFEDIRLLIELNGDHLFNVKLIEGKTDNDVILAKNDLIVSEFIEHKSQRNKTLAFTFRHMMDKCVH